MTKTEYKQARQLIRANGNYALRWLSNDVAATFKKLLNAKPDYLADRLHDAKFLSAKQNIDFNSPVVFHFQQLP